MKKRMLALALCLALVLSLGLPCFAAEEKSVTGVVHAEMIAKYGNLIVEIDTDAFEKLFAWGDVLEAEFLNQKVEMPFCPAYSYVDSGLPVAIVDEGVVKVALNMGDFATTYKIATKTVNEDKTFFWTFCDGVEDPVKVTFRMKQAKGYFDEFTLRSLTYTSAREDYPDLTDEEFANFRAVKTTGMGENVLYRCATPFDPEFGRDTYTEAALKKAGIKTIVNLAYIHEDLEKFDTTYYQTLYHIELGMSMNPTGSDFKAALGDGLRFLLDSEAPYAINCKEGKDRTGFVIAVLEALMGAGYEEIMEDYLLSFRNYYGVEKDSTQENALVKSFAATLQSAFGGRDAQTADLADCAQKYLGQCGLSKDEIAALKQALSGFQPAEGEFVDVSADSYFCEAVKWASENEITTGKDKTHFDPYATVSRAEVVTFLWRAAGCPVPDYYMQMTDVPSGSYYSNAVRWALAEKITTGTSETTFSPDAPCNRGQIVTFLWRYAGAEPSGATRSAFIDVLTCDYFWDAVYWAGIKGITTGTSATTFNPYAWCNRAQAVTFLYRMMNAE